MKTLAIIYTKLDSDKMKSYANNLDRFSFNIFGKNVIQYVKDALLLANIPSVLDNQVLDETIDEYENILVVYGCIPTVSKESIDNLIKHHQNSNNSITYQEGLFVFNKDVFKKEKDKILNNIVYAIKDNLNSYQNVEEVNIVNSDDLIIIEDRVKLALASKIIQKRINTFHMLNGISIVDPNTTYIDCDVKIGNDTIIYPNTYIYNKSIIGVGCELGPNTYIKDSYVDNRMVLKNCSIENQILKTK